MHDIMGCKKVFWFNKQYSLTMSILWKDLKEIMSLSEGIIMNLIKASAPHNKDSDNRIWKNRIDLFELFEAFSNINNYKAWNSWFGIRKKWKTFVRMENPNIISKRGEMIYDGGSCCFCGLIIDNKVLLTF